MKFRGPVFLSIVAIILLMLGAFYPSQEKASEKESILMHTMLGGLNQLHYQPLNLDDEFSKKVFRLYLDRIDGGRRWLIQKDVDELKQFELDIDNESEAGNFDYFDHSLKLLESGISRAKKIYADILSKPFDFDKDETFEIEDEDKPFAKNEKELKEYWHKSLKYETMTRLANKLEKQKNNSEADKAASIESLEAESRKEVLEKYDDLFERIGDLRRSDRLSDYLNAITNVYDPHTGYFEPKDKENFDIGMSGTLEGIGARLQTEGEFTKVVSIVPGGPAWKQKELENDDLIMKVEEDGKDAVDVTGYRLDDVVKLIRGDKGTKVTLTVKKVDGTIKDIPIIRDVVIIDESYAKSMILDFPGKIENVGYIRLPRFYADFNRSEGRSCAEDVAKELEKLKAQNVNGIILDLRDNGGGSLRDVVTMSGLFIEKGPIVQVKARGSSPEVLKDDDPKVQYDGDLIVMVNSYSASASEILAAALQDYGRAVIVGSKSTYGKGTVQRFFDLDRAIRGYNEVKPLGEVKLTIQKFYRVNGGSTQLRGVEPDIVLPDRFQFIDIGEKDHKYAMQWSEIDPVPFGQSVTTLDGLQNWKKASEARVKENETFQLVLESANRLKVQRDQKSYSLNLKKYQQEEEKLEKEAEKYDNIFKEIEGLKVYNLEEDLAAINADESHEARNEEFIKSLRSDIYIDEVLNILRDMKN
jgi:carboxyl-terminal processing protease